MQDGMAEVFGTEMVRGKEYQFGPGTKLAIFSYHGCVIGIKGKTKIRFLYSRDHIVFTIDFSFVCIFRED